MIISGKYTEAKVFASEIESSAEGQIKSLCDQSFASGAKIRIMPDVHAGKGCTIGTTMTVTDAVVPNLVGVDIGCGMETVLIEESRVNLPKLDAFIRENIPHGFSVREKPHSMADEIDLSELRCADRIDLRRALESLGSLGGGNHFIEVDKDEEGVLYLIIHSGSRNPGLKVAEYYQKLAYEALGGKAQSDTPFELAYLTGDAKDDYLHDMALMQRFADLNRHIMKTVILKGMKLKEKESFTTVHNYIDTEDMILRKGAVSAKKGEKLLIPLNMRDGALICTGLGNPEWNESAPHGAGRIMSRGEANSSFTVSAFKKAMDGIFTTSVDQSTLDECPMAYKNAESIIDAIGETARIEKRVLPIYNFKSSDKAEWSKKRK
ncbi:MAG: RtcB family protein [Clostridia bacterium]|nr:RtcB family protein [Clostridia bacterium]